MSLIILNSLSLISYTFSMPLKPDLSKTHTSYENRALLDMRPDPLPRLLDLNDSEHRSISENKETNKALPKKTKPHSHQSQK